MPRVMLDGVTPSSVPSGAPMYLGYVDGQWPDYQVFVQREPHALHVSCTVTGRPGAHVFDIEPGDGSPTSGADWALNELHAQRLPCLYAPLSYWPATDKACQARGIYGKVLRMLTHPQPDGTIPSGFVAVQWAFYGGYDQSSVVDYWPGLDPPPHPKETDVPKFVQVPGQPDIYLVNGVYKRHLPTPAILAREQQVWGDTTIHPVEQAYLDSYNETGTA